MGAHVEVKRHDEITLSEISACKPKKIVISPGPCAPDQAGISLDVIKTFYKDLPILGVCLGHQCMAQAFGGKIIRAPKVMHGKTSAIYHDGLGVFHNLPNPFDATRYHSLIAEEKSLPSDFIISARTSDDVIMGIRHKDYPIEGVQFHPESILTKVGHDLLKNFLKM